MRIGKLTTRLNNGLGCLYLCEHETFDKLMTALEAFGYYDRSKVEEIDKCSPIILIFDAEHKLVCHEPLSDFESRDDDVQNELLENASQICLHVVTDDDYPYLAWACSDKLSVVFE